MKDEYSAILDRIEASREGEALTDVDIKEYLADKRTGKLSSGQNELGDILFEEHMKRFDARVEEKVEEKKTITVFREGKEYHKSYLKWDDTQENFIKQRIGKMSEKQIAYEYNNEFFKMGLERSDASIKSKIYKLKK